MEVNLFCLCGRGKKFIIFRNIISDRVKKDFLMSQSGPLMLLCQFLFLPLPENEKFVFFRFPVFPRTASRDSISSPEFSNFSSWSIL